MQLNPTKCYVDGEECDCDAFDVAGDCPRDSYAHDDDFVDEELIDDAYELLKGMNHDDEVNRY
jgi:hypothetical protein